MINNLYYLQIYKKVAKTSAFVAFFRPPSNDIKNMGAIRKESAHVSNKTSLRFLFAEQRTDFCLAHLYQVGRSQFYL